MMRILNLIVLVCVHALGVESGPAGSPHYGVAGTVAPILTEMAFDPSGQAPVTCGYAQFQVEDCLGFEPSGDALAHMERRRNVQLFLIAIVAISALCTDTVVKSFKQWIHEYHPESVEILHALCKEITVLGFITLTVICSTRLGFLRSLSEVVFGRIEGTPTQVQDVRDGFPLSELTVILEDVHWQLFHVMLFAVLVSLLNISEVHRGLREWEEAERLEIKYGFRAAMQLLVEEKMERDKHLGSRYGRKNSALKARIQYLTYKREFMAPVHQARADGVDPELFPFLLYLQTSVKKSIVEIVEVPIWLWCSSGIVAVLVITPYLYVSHNSPAGIVTAFTVVPYGLLASFCVVSWKVRQIEDLVGVDDDKVLAFTRDESDAKYVGGRRFEDHVQPDRPAGGWLAEKLCGTRAPSVFEQLFWMHRHGPAFLSALDRLLLFWVVIYLAVWTGHMEHYRFTWRLYPWTVVAIIVPLVLIIFVIYPRSILERVLVTTTEYSPSLAAIRHVNASQQLEVLHMKELVIAVLKRDAMRICVHDAAANTATLEQLADSFDDLPEQVKRDCLHAFTTYDNDGSGFLDRAELYRCLEHVNLGHDDIAKRYPRAYSVLARDDWFELLSVERGKSGITLPRFKVLCWALYSTPEMPLREDHLVEIVDKFLQAYGRKTKQVQTTMDSRALEAFVAWLTRSHFSREKELGRLLLREAAAFERDTGMEAEKVLITMHRSVTGLDTLDRPAVVSPRFFALLLVEWEHRLSAFRGLE